MPSGYQPFRVLNWNILAQLYATEQEYPYVPRHVLSWGSALPAVLPFRRAKRLVESVSKYM